MSDPSSRRRGGEPASASTSASGAGGSGATLRGALIIGVAVLLGILLLGKGLDTGFVPTSDEATPRPGSDDDGGDDTTDGTEPTDGAPADTRPPAEVTVWVLNGGGPTGTATEGTTLVANAGYRTVPASNAPENVAQSIVYYVEGYQADAAAVAGVLGLPADRVTALPNPPPVANGDIQGSQVIAVLSTDFSPG
jgi:hypothetical protein